MSAKLFIVFFLGFFSMSTKCNFVPGFPDAIRCGMQGVDGEGAILFLHGANLGVAHYRQIYSGEDRLVTFIDGKYFSHVGHQGSVGWCVNKTIHDLVKNKRAWGFA